MPCSMVGVRRNASRLGLGTSPVSVRPLIVVIGMGSIGSLTVLGHLVVLARHRMVGVPLSIAWRLTVTATPLRRDHVEPFLFVLDACSLSSLVRAGKAVRVQVFLVVVALLLVSVGAFIVISTLPRLICAREAVSQQLFLVVV